MDAVTFDADGVVAHEDLQAAREAPGTTWVHADLRDEATVERIRAVFELHPLVVEDLQRDVRPKTEEFGPYTFVLLKSARLRRGDTSFAEELDDEPVGVLLGSDWLVTLAAPGVAAVTDARGGLDRGDPRLLERGADFAAYRVVDSVVDEYFDVLDDVETRIERVEEAILAEPGEDVLRELNSARRELLSARKLLWPTREAVSVLARGDPDQVGPTTEKYFRDVYDHVVQLVDLTETYRDLAAGARDIYLNALSQSTNEVMKTLTVVATVVLPLTLVVGLFGMNFQAMPELTWPYAYPAVLLGMAAVSALLVWNFRAEGWL